MRAVFDVCWPSSRTIVRTFKTLKAAREFARNMTADDLPLVMPWQRNTLPIIARRDRTRL